MAAQFDALNRKAKSLESRLEVRLLGGDFFIYRNLSQQELISISHEYFFFMMLRFIYVLKKKIQNYSTCAQKINADFLCDEGNKKMRGILYFKTRSNSIILNRIILNILCDGTAFFLYYAQKTLLLRIMKSRLFQWKLNTT